MKRLVLLLPLLLGLGSYAQTRYAYLPEGVTAFQTSSEKVIIGFREGSTPSEKTMSRLYGSMADTAIRSTIGRNKWNVFSLNPLLKNTDAVKQILSDLRSDTTVAYVNPFLVYKNGTLQGLTDQVNVRLKSTTTLAQLAPLFKRLGVYKVKPNPYLEREYFLTIHPTDQFDALDAADSLHDTGLFEYSEPDFVIAHALSAINPNDALFSYQWNLQNTGQYNGTVGSDIKAPAAWCTATGVGIKVAIIDEGVDPNHPDLQGNVLPGYDALNQGTNGAPTGNDAHGTACAGLVAALSNNSIGISGIAHNAKIISVRAASESFANYSAAAVGIGWAISTAGGSADVISISFGGGSTSSTFNNAISNAITNGRGGKGCVVLISSGDIEANAIEYPSNLPNVIAVGGTNPCDQRFTIAPGTPSTSCNYDTRIGNGYNVSGGSSYGTGLGVVAPGINIATLDISGTAGFGMETGQGWEMSGTDYVLNFDGTSASTPQAAAVAALVLSVNPNLIYSQVAYYLENTADKVGGYPYATNNPNGRWDPQMGYGRLNAASAVAKAVSSSGMVGPSYLCSGSAAYSVAVPSGITTTWSVSNGAASLSCTSCSATTMTAVTTGSVVLTATFANSCGALPLATLTKSVYIKQNPVAVNSTPGNCGGTSQNWYLAATPASGSNWNWAVTSGSGMYINSPSASSTYVDVTNGGGITLTYKDLCLVNQSAGVTVYKECGAGDIAMTPNPASSTVMITHSNPLNADAESSTLSMEEETQTVSVEADSSQMKPSGNRLNQLSTIRIVKIMDVAGRVRKTLTYSIGIQQATIDVSDLPRGMYFVQIFDDRHFVTKKLMIQK